MRTLFAMAALWVVAAWHRLQVLNEAVVSSDSLGPYLQAYSVFSGALPRPPNPESGDALWLLAWPMVAGADSLECLFWLRFVLGGVVAPLGFIAAWAWTSPSASAGFRWAASLASGLFLAFDPGLLDTLVSGARSYGAPELVGLATLFVGLAMGGHRWAPAAATVSLVFAAGHHPLALGMGAGALLLVPTLRQQVGDKALVHAAIAGVVAAIPRLLRIGALTLCGEGPLQCLGSVARSNVDPTAGTISVLTKALHDRFLVDLGNGGLLLGLGVVLVGMCVTRRHRWAAVLAAGGLLGILGLGILTGYVRSYHLRIAAVPIAVAAGMGFARAWPVALVAAGLTTAHWLNERPVGPDPGAVERHDTIAAALPDRERTLWVDGLWWNGPPRTDPAGVVLGAILAGRPAADFSLSPDSLFVVLVSGDGPRPAGERVLYGDDWDVKIASGPAATGVWLEEQIEDPHQRGGAYDWATVLDPETTLEDAHW